LAKKIDEEISPKRECIKTGRAQGVHNHWNPAIAHSSPEQAIAGEEGEGIKKEGKDSVKPSLPR